MQIIEPIKVKEQLKVRLPKRRIHKTPRLLMGDAYTIGSYDFESTEALEKSVYYITFRKLLSTIETGPYKKGDDRIIFSGLARLLDYLFYEPITHEEIDETKRFLAHAKATRFGFKDYSFPEQIWRKVVDDYNGRPPIKISAVREGSVVYPNEPVVVVESTSKPGEMMGVLAAWFESKLLMVWSASEMVTQLEHWLLYCREMVVKVYGDTVDEAIIDFLASLMLHNFGDRAGICPQESEWMAADALYVFGGTDTFAGAYQAWKNGKEESGIASSVKALAHRNVQSYEKEFDCYRAIYEAAEDFDIISCVSDCYDFWYANEGDGTGKDGSLLSLALESKRTNNGKVVVSRPDSGKAVEQVLWLCRLALKHGLYEEKEINGKMWRFGTTLKFIEGDGMTWSEMKAINDALMEQGFAPFGWGLYGVGGGLRNYLKRDNFSAKYALCAVGTNLRPVVKFSETLGKTTLPGPFKLLRSKDALAAKKTIVFEKEDGADELEIYFDGSIITDPFCLGKYVVAQVLPNTYCSPQEDTFRSIKARIKEQMKTMPLTLATEENHGYPASDKIRAERKRLLKKYAKKKLAQNY